MLLFILFYFNNILTLHLRSELQSSSLGLRHTSGADLLLFSDLLLTLPATDGLLLLTDTSLQLSINHCGNQLWEAKENPSSALWINT